MIRILLFFALVGCSQNEVLHSGHLPKRPINEATTLRGDCDLPVDAPLRVQTEPLSIDCNKSLFITEIHPDPKRVRDRQGEFVELYNASKEPIRLNGWRLLDDGNDSHVVTSSTPLVVAPQKYIVLGVNEDQKSNAGVPVDYEYKDFHLANHADSVILEDPCGNRIAEIRYPLEKHWPKHKAGRSIVRYDRPREPGIGRWRLAKTRLSSGERASPGTGVWEKSRRKR